MGRAPSAWWPGATAWPVSYAGLAGPFTAPVRGWVLHVVVGDGSPWRTFEHAPAGSRRFSHLWVAKDGRAEQYQPLDHKAWAQAAGNAEWWSVETEGQPSEPLTMAQLRTLAEWHVWSLTPDQLAESPDGHGIGTHYMGGLAWGGHSCPDPAPGAGPRSKQRQQIIDTARALRAQGTDVAQTLSEDDLNAIAAKVWGSTFGTSPTTGVLLQHAAQAVDPTAIARQVAALLPAAGATPADVETAVRHVLRGLTVTLAP